MKNYRHFHRLCTAAWLLVASAALHAANVTFQVNMSAQTGLGTFDPDADTVFVAGDAINNWSSSTSELTRNAVDPKIWEGTFAVDGLSGSTVQYKFIKNTAVNGVIWEGNVGDNGAQNRSFVLADTDQSLPVTYFNNVTNSTTSTAHVTFQLDLSVQVQLGNFDPDTGTVTVAGDAINNWNAT
ncbi:MAG TPA: CBM20 domain-containing protein, partial [Candidatus Limnocylindria bacterium]|nr:CBM20 domain-containing protein [Candidatus Limnocylindria bacterium]